MKMKVNVSRCLLIGVSSIMLIVSLPTGSPAATMEERQLQAIKQNARTLSRSRDVKERREAAKSMGYYAFPQAIPPLIGALVDSEERVRMAAASSLWDLSDQAKEVDGAESALRQALNDAVPGVQIRASWALKNMGIPSSELIPTWRVVLQTSPKDYDRFWAAYGLIGTEPPLDLIQPVLTYAQKDADSKMGERALVKLAATQDRSLIPPMRKALSIFHPGNELILEALKTFQPESDGWVELVLSQTEFGNDRLTLNALGLLRNRPRKEEDIAIWLPVVGSLVEADDEGVCSMSISLLGMAGGHAQDSLPILLDLLISGPDASIRRDAAAAIGEIGDRSQSFPDEMKKTVALKAKPALQRSIRQESDRSACMAAIRSLAKLQIEPSEIQPLLVDMAIGGKDILVQSAALQALSLCGSAPAELVSRLADYQKTAPPRVARQVESTIKSMQSGRTTSPVLSANASDKSPQAAAMTELRSMDADFDEMAFFRALSLANGAKIRSYLDAGVSPDYRFTSMNNQSALYALVNSMRACNAKIRPTPEKTKALVRLFLEKGADPNQADNMGNTPLMGAASKCDAELIQLLLDAGADPNIQTQAGLTAIEFTILFANDGVEALIDAGARLSADKLESYKAAYGANPAALKLMKRASEP